VVQFKELCELCERLSQVSSRISKINLVVEFLKRADLEEISAAISLIMGNLPKAYGQPLNLSHLTLYRTVLRMTKVEEEKFFGEFSQTGDVGETVKRILEKYPSKTQKLLKDEPITCREVAEALQQIAEFTGAGARVKKERLLESLLGRVSPLEAKYLVKNLLGEMRHGFGEGLMEEALARAFNIGVEKIRIAHMSIGDLGRLGRLLKSKGQAGLEAAVIVPFHPVKPMLAEHAESLEEVLRQHGGKTCLEDKLDGVRVQIHKVNSEVRIYSRRLTEVTDSFPEVSKTIKEKVQAKEAIIDGEIVAVDHRGRFQPFQEIMKRYGRIKETYDFAKHVPVALFLFDILHLNGMPLIDKPLMERKAILEKIVPSRMLVRSLTAVSLDEARRFFEEAIGRRCEGVVAKRPDSTYTPGIRGKKWLKIKRPPYTLDLVIVAAEYGYGYRHKWLSDYYLAASVQDGEKKDSPTTFPEYVEAFHGGKFEIVGKTFKGLTNEEIKTLTQRLQNIALKTEGRAVIVKPEIVAEIAFSEIQRSPQYSSGYALRFARIIRIRDDKTVSEISNLKDVERVFLTQHRVQDFGRV
jgi:DNA ligase-1